MRTSILVGITLCLLLLALPAAASEDYTLDIFGNANEDDTINMQDVTYTELIILEYRDQTELADAKYDGRINMQDVTQIELVILGRELEITVMDAPGPSRGRLPEAVTIQKPVGHVVVPGIAQAETLRSLDAADTIIGVTDRIKIEETYFPTLSKLPSVGTGEYNQVDYEAILAISPDIYFGSPSRDKDKLPSIVVMEVDVMSPINIAKDIRKLGYIFDKRDEACEFINWHDDWVNHIKERTDGLTEDEKPKVFYWDHFKPGGPYTSYGNTRDNRFVQASEIAGGTNILVGEQGGNIDPEFVTSQNPDIILARPIITPRISGYSADDPSIMAAARDDILSRVELAEVTAIVDEEVYLVDYLGVANAGSGAIVCIAYFAKWLQPDLFEDLNPETIHEEYLHRFQHLDYDLNEHGVFAYPPIEIDGGLAGIPDRYRG